MTDEISKRDVRPAVRLGSGRPAASHRDHPPWSYEGPHLPAGFGPVATAGRSHSAPDCRGAPGQPPERGPLARSLPPSGAAGFGREAALGPSDPPRWETAGSDHRLGLQHSAPGPGALALASAGG